MPNAKLVALAATPGWRLDGDIAHGARGGYAFSLTVNNNFAANLYLPKTIDGDELRKSIANNRKALGVATVLWNRNIGLLTLNMSTVWGNAAKFTETMLGHLDAIAEHLRAFGVAHDHCVLCETDGATDALLYKGIRVRAHAACIDRVMEQEEAHTLSLQDAPRYPMGILGALLGAAISAIPWLVCLFVFEYMFAICAVLIPAGAAFGYRLFTGKRFGPLSRPIVLGASLLGLFFAFFAQIVGLAMIVISTQVEIGLGNVLSIAGVVLQDFPGTVSAFYSIAGSDLVMNALYLAGFGIAGIVSTWRLVPKNQAMAQQYQRLEAPASLA